MIVNLLKEVYINLLDQKEPKLNLESSEALILNLIIISLKIKISQEKLLSLISDELELHIKNIFENHLY